jgi:hypothetical protein
MGEVKMLKLKRLKKIIDVEQGRKRTWVAKQIGMKVSSFRQVIAGINNLSKEKAVKLSEILKIDLSEIWKE